MEIGAIASAAGELLRRRTGEYREDEWGFDRGFAEAALPGLDLLYKRWWRVHATGLENVPGKGRALLVANHAGMLPFDAAMMSTAIRRLHPSRRWPRFMVLDWAFELPYVSHAVRRVGGVPANPYNAQRLLEQDELVMAFPEGAKGSGKPYSDRYRVQRFGRGGFVEIALRSRAPIIPVAVVGSEEIYPFGPLGPLGLLPLPSRWRIEFCPPVDLSAHPPDAAEDRALILDVSAQVRDTVQRTIRENLIERGGAFV
jgi:1-acyl-sn-glycerol-3-phosphate acyltransferase